MEKITVEITRKNEKEQENRLLNYSGELRKHLEEKEGK